MRRSTVRFLAFIVLTLLGAPVAMHVVIHDLHDHRGERTSANYSTNTDHGDHEHPLVSSPAPRVASLTRAVLTLVTAPAATSAVWISTARMERNVIAHGALRSGDDVGLHALLSTLLI